ncbi:MAG: chromosome segregation protein SMC, partial [Candidatus Aureabacteria bacterium]|nr:chromosome segregation protein SMC [Candidatus Auribacterota bacterium]
MLLKRITLLGFKSFADKTDLVFTKGVTSIVGPNGGGKSNIVDAIRWVLGEQSIKTLRGAKMEDVIFNGCESRQAAGMCEVSITFDNEDGILPIDFKEVTVTRRLFKSGESQYLINKTQCRLKDVHELFINTGIGTSSYSVIEQGEMDRIINSRPVDRREIFEEAAGITKYKSKKKEAERKLKFAEDNLLRLKDIIVELAKQKDSLSRQASKARRYKNLSQELKNLDCQYARHRYQLQLSEIESVKTALRKAEESILNEKENIRNLEQEHKEYQDKLALLEFHGKELAEKKHAIENSLNQHRQSIEHNESRMADIRSRIEEDNSATVVHQEKKDELHSVLQQIQLEKEQFIRLFTEKKQALETRSASISGIFVHLEETKARIASSKEQIESIKTLYAEAQNKLVENQTHEKNLEDQMEKLNEEIEDIKLSLSFEEEQFERMRISLDSAKSRKLELSKRIEEKEKEIQEKTQALSDLEAEMIRISSELTEKDSRKSVLEDMKNSYEGFFAGVRGIMLKKQEDPDLMTGVIGVISDVIKVQPEYEVAAEVALGTRIQNILVEKGEDAQRAIGFLKDHKLGRATFLPLDMVKIRESKKEKPTDPRILGCLLDFIHYDSLYKEIMESLLSHFLVVRELKDAMDLIREGKSGFNFVTIGGELVAGTGAITGGETKAAVRGFLNRENEIVELDQEVRNLRQLLLEKNELRNEHKCNIQTEREKIEELKIKADSASSELHDVERDFQKIVYTKESYQKRLNQLYTELEQLSGHKNSLVQTRDELNQKLMSSSNQDQNLNQTLLTEESELEQILSSLTEQKEISAREKAEIESLNEKILSLDSRIADVRKELEERDQWLKNFELNQNQARELMQDLQKEIQDSQRAIELYLSQQSQLFILQKQFEEELTALKNSIDSFDGNRQALQEKIDGLNESNTAWKVQIAEMEGKILSLRELIFSKYQIRIEEIVQDSALESFSWDQASQRIEELETKIRHLGPVNLAAIEELEALQKRLTFLTEQEQDLVAAKTQLIEVIEKINICATKMFQETFEKIKVYFGDIFKELFGGGKCEITILNEQGIDYLEQGIDIVAMPPEKRPQTISLLSGGEKALTAVALLFALFKVKPSPFCVVDELDAPLDEANVIRFTRLLKSFTENTQFIVITHNKITIQMADLLYGVTQEVKGISRLISMKFVDEELEAFLADMPHSEEAVSRI